MLQLALEESRRAATGPGVPSSPSAAASLKPRAPRPRAPRPPRRPASLRTPGGVQAAKGSRAAATPATAAAPRARRVDGSDDDDDDGGVLATPRFGRLLPPRPPPACARVPPLASALAALRALDSGSGRGGGVLLSAPLHLASISSAASDGDRRGARSPSPLSPRSAASSSSSVAAAAAAAAAARAPSVADSLAETLAADADALRAVHAAEGGRLLDDGCWTAAGRGGRWAAAPKGVAAPLTLPPSRLGKARLAGAAAAPTHTAAGSFAAACAALSSRLLLRTTARAWDEEDDGGSEWTRDLDADAHATPDPADDALARQSLEAATLDALRRWLGRDG